MVLRHHRGMWAAISLWLVGCGMALGQGPPPAPSAPSQTFHARVEELARALQNNPRLKNLSEQQRLDRLEFVMGNTLFTLLHEMGHVAIAAWSEENRTLRICYELAFDFAQLYEAYLAAAAAPPPAPAFSGDQGRSGRADRGRGR